MEQIDNIQILINNANWKLRNLQTDEALILFNDILKIIDKNNIVEWNENFWYYIFTLLWIWECYMRLWDFEKASEYYEQANKLWKSKQFDIVFNLWVCYANIKDEKNAKKYINIAKKIDPKNENLIKFLDSWVLED